MITCVICNKEILEYSQYINDKYYHNCCIEDLQKQNSKLKEENQKLRDLLVNNVLTDEDFNKEKE